MKLLREDIKKAKFDDIFFIDDEQGLAVLEDIEEVPNTRDPKEGILSAKGDFVYEVKFFINSLLALTNGISYIIVNVYAERPLQEKPKRKTRNATSSDIRSMIRSRKRPDQRAVSKSDDPTAVADETPTDSTSFAPTQEKNIVGYARISLGPALSKEDLENYSKFRSTEATRRREALAERMKYEYVSSVKEDLSAKSIKPEGRVAIDTVISPALTISSPSGITSRSGFVKTTAGKGRNASTIKLSMDSIFKSGIDPALASKTRFPINTLKDQISGNRAADKSRSSAKMNRSSRKKSGSPERTRKNVGQRRSVKEGSNIAMLSVIMPSSPRLQTPTLAALSAVNISIPEKTPEKVVKESPAILSFESRAIEFEREVDVQIPRTGAKDQLYFEVQLISRLDNTPAFSKIYPIGHKEQLSEFLSPEVPPSVGKGSQMRGRNYLTLQQHDPVATQIIVEKKTLNPNADDMSIPYEEIAKVNVTQDMGIELWEDNDAENIEPNVIMYRVIAVSPLGDEGEEYGSVIFSGLQPIAGIGGNYGTDRVKCSIHAINNIDRINIEISDIPPGATALRLIREDLTSDSYTANSDRPRYVVPNLSTGATMTIMEGTTSVVLYEDTNVEPFRQYRYQCIFRLERGPEALGQGEEVIQHIRPRSEVPVAPEIGNLKVKKEELLEPDPNTSLRPGQNVHNMTSVSFTISATPTDNGIEAVSQILAAAGVEQAFVDDVRNDRNRVSDIAAYVVERLDMKTGRRESFGLQRPGTFNDNERSRKKRRVSTPLSGRTYKYVAKLCLRPPEALFKEALTKVDVQNPAVLDTATESIETLGQRFLSSFGVFPSLPSDTELKDSRTTSIREQFQKGLTGIELVIDVTMPSVRPRVTRVKSYRTKRGFNVVRWLVEGDLSRIDHFVIFARYRGVTAPIGVASSRGNGSYRCFDRILSGEIGDINYFVRIVYTDYTRSEASSETNMSRKRDMSRSLWARLMKINARSRSKDASRRRLSETEKNRDMS